VILLLILIFSVAAQQAFGPILPIMKLSSDEEAIKLANDSKNGLGCAVFFWQPEACHQKSIPNTLWGSSNQ
jgi:acyl-CoA reductase-like NAD-dependent aldehyde dehydrogenase